MKLIFESSFLIHNLKILEEAFQDVGKKFKLSRDNDGRFILGDDEVVVLKLYGAKYAKQLTVHSNLKHTHLNEGRVVRKKDQEMSVEEAHTYLTNKYLHIVTKRHIKINYNLIETINVYNNKIVIKHNQEEHTLLLGNLKTVAQIVFVIDALSKVELDAKAEGKTVEINFEKKIVH